MLPLFVALTLGLGLQPVWGEAASPPVDWVQMTVGPSGAVREAILSPDPHQDTLWTRHRIRVEASDLYVVTHRSGLLSFLGHEHSIIPMDWEGEACLPDSMVPGARGLLTLSTPSLIIDSDSARNLAGLGKGPGEADRNDIQETLLDESHLSAEGYPEIRLESTVEEVLAGASEGTGKGESEVRLRSRLSVRGMTREYPHEVRVERTGDGGLQIAGTLEVRQTEFDIEPESIFGMVKVSDPVDLHFRLVTAPTGQSCSPDSIPIPNPIFHPDP